MFSFGVKQRTTAELVGGEIPAFAVAATDADSGTATAAEGATATMFMKPERLCTATRGVPLVPAAKTGTAPAGVQSPSGL